ncbi:MAG: serine/threonine-protein kinase [Pseudomonadota bacterium]
MRSLPPEPSGATPAPPPADPLWQATEILPRPAPARGNALPAGAHLAEFELLRVLGEGGFGIVYLAHDHSLQRRVAIKEYMPASLAMRSGAQEVVVTAEKHRAVFSAGLDSFINEARLLAQFDHPSLLKVYRFWRANGTAYMVMPYYEGSTLKQKLRQAGTAPDERWLMALLASLTEALAVVHAEHCLHRDIAPDNILLLADSGRPLLLDFGAARQVIGDATQALTAILKPGYAPVEQYAEAPALKQGPWTDIYALCAVVYAAVMGSKPPVSVGRTVVDSCVPLARAAAGRYSERFLQAIDAGLRVHPDSRPASVLAFRQALGLEARPTSAAAMPLLSPAPPAAPPATQPAAAPVPAATTTTSSTASTEPARGLRRRALPGLGIAMALLALVAAAFWAGQRLQAPAAVPATAPSTPAATAVAAGPATTPATTTAAPLAAAPAPVQPATLSIQTEFQRLMLGRAVDFSVQASANASTLRIGRDRLGFRVTSARDGHVYVLVGGPDGSLVLLFPNSMAPDSRIRAGQTLALPQPHWPLDTSDPAGTEQFAVLVSEHPRDFSHLSQERVAWFLKLPTGTAGAALAQSHGGAGSVVAGQARCNTPGCDRYGAALFSVEVVQ